MPSDSHVVVDFKHQLGTLALSAQFNVTAPWTVLFGPSGSGKSTILRAIAGLVRPHSGTIHILGKQVSGPRAWIPPHRRPIRWAAQQPALFPRKTVKGNLVTGLGNDGVFSGRGWIDEIDQAIDVFDLHHLAGAYPAELSGGQRQRVSVIRAAIGARGRVLLLDEPFSGLDAAIRDQLLTSLRTWLGPTPILSVTHDIGEAFLLQAEVIRLHEGRVTAQGPAAEVLAPERAHLQALLQSAERP